MEHAWRSWHPRRPSARLKQRLFRAERAARAPARWLWATATATPALACLCVALMVQEANHAGLQPKPGLPANLSMDHLDFSAFDGTDDQENRLAAVTFDWTNHAVFRSSIRFTPGTNLSRY